MWDAGSDVCARGAGVLAGSELAGRCGDGRKRSWMQPWESGEARWGRLGPHVVLGWVHCLSGMGGGVLGKVGSGEAVADGCKCRARESRRWAAVAAGCVVRVRGDWRKGEGGRLGWLDGGGARISRGGEGSAGLGEVGCW